jgi:hypothetical protein
VIVELSNEGAKRGRRRGAGRSLEYEGTIKEKGEGTLTLSTSHKTEVDVAVNDDTVIRKGHTTFTFDELEVDWRVHVKAYELEGVLTAREVKVQNMGDDDDDDGDDPAATMTANGTVLSNDGGTLVVRTSAHDDVTVQTDGSTIIGRQGVIIPVEEIEVELGRSIRWARASTIRRCSRARSKSAATTRSRTDDPPGLIFPANGGPRAAVFHLGRRQSRRQKQLYRRNKIEGFVTPS